MVTVWLSYHRTVPNIPVHYTNAIDLFFGLLSKFCSLGTAQAFGFLSEENIAFSFWMSLHYGTWYDCYDHFDQDSSRDGQFCAQITATSPNILQENSTFQEAQLQQHIRVWPMSHFLLSKGNFIFISVLYFYLCFAYSQVAACGLLALANTNTE